jgi:hypothetical protein
VISALLAALDYLLSRTQVLSHLTRRLMRDPGPFVVLLPDVSMVDTRQHFDFDRNLLSPIPATLMLIDGSEETNVPIFGMIMDAWDTRPTVSWIASGYDRTVRVTAPPNAVGMVVYRLVDGPSSELLPAALDAVGMEDGTQVYLVSAP